MRDYGYDGQIGAEPRIHEYIEHLVAVFREVRRVLRSDGTLWLNIGNTRGHLLESGQFRPRQQVTANGAC